MQPLRITIDINPQHIPDIVCGDYADAGSADARYLIAAAIAQALGVEEFLSQPDRVYELRRRIWERGDIVANTREFVA